MTIPCLFGAEVGGRTAAHARSASILQWTYPGRVDQARLLRPALRSLLSHCPVADEVVTLAWELAANSCQHSDSGQPGGHITVEIRDFPGDYVYAAVHDQGGAWDADLGAAAQCPHGLYLLRQLAATCGIAGGPDGRVVWFTLSYPRTDQRSFS
jgi:anti-sigma regulatory factor (Ser/Thr protein kinase)